MAPLWRAEDQSTLGKSRPRQEETKYVNRMDATYFGWVCAPGGSVEPYLRSQQVEMQHNAGCSRKSPRRHHVTCARIYAVVSPGAGMSHVLADDEVFVACASYTIRVYRQIHGHAPAGTTRPHCVSVKFEARTCKPGPNFLPHPRPQTPHPGDVNTRVRRSI